MIVNVDPISLEEFRILHNTYRGRISASIMHAENCSYQPLGKSHLRQAEEALSEFERALTIQVRTAVREPLEALRDRVNRTRKVVQKQVTSKRYEEMVVLNGGSLE